METVIEVRDLVKEYRSGFWLTRKARVLDGVSFAVRPNQVFGLLGPNGAGKTTTLKILMGLVRPTAGQVNVFGQPVNRTEVRHRVGFLPENPYYYMYLSGREFMRFCADLFGLARALRRQRSDELLELVGLKDDAGKLLRTYSKGMLQRIGIAQALINDPDLVYLDEPTSGLDPIGRREVRLIMQQLRQRGKTVFFNTHILPDVQEICDHAAIMVKGHIRIHGNLEDLTRGPAGQRYLLSAQDIPPAGREKLPQLGPTRVLQTEDGRWEALFPDEEKVLRAAGCIGDWGGQIRSVGLYHRPLEEVFMETVQQAAGEEKPA